MIKPKKKIPKKAKKKRKNNPFLDPETKKKAQESGNKRKFDKTYTLKEEFLAVFEQKMCLLSVTCRALNMSRETYYGWIKKDHNFLKRCQEIQVALKDFGEAKLISLMNADNANAIIHFNKTKNRDRGYGEQASEQTSEPIVIIHKDGDSTISNLRKESISSAESDYQGGE
jgi:hypothetical protein